MKEIFEDDRRETVTLMLRHRLPWLILGLLGGVIATILASRFENVLASNIRLAFFIPIIVYMADALGSQTETVFIRNLGKRTMKHHIYLLKETILGIILGLFFGFIIGLFAFVWFQSYETALIVGFALLVTMSVAPTVALIIPLYMAIHHKDPAIGAGPITTVIQDLISLLIYFVVASVIIFW